MFWLWETIKLIDPISGVDLTSLIADLKFISGVEFSFDGFKTRQFGDVVYDPKIEKTACALRKEASFKNNQPMTSRKKSPERRFNLQ